mmetsp:Transcript_1666/g.4543  ORF Transcript_1666/g.4543 Transcript_1666/m.4543 type:complete len:80 (-) Transcript_1666:868-1107(-)
MAVLSPKYAELSVRISFAALQDGDCCGDLGILRETWLLQPSLTRKASHGARPRYPSVLQKRVMTFRVEINKTCIHSARC